MQYKDILVFLDDGDSNSQRVKAVFQLAEYQQARVTGVTLASIKPRNLEVKNAKAVKESSELAAQQRIDEFLQAASGKGIEADSRILHGELSYTVEKMAQLARNFDLVVLRQARPDSDGYAMSKALAEQVILLSGRPVFFMPYIGAHRIPCLKAMIAWDGTPTAARAVHDAIPMLTIMEKVMILVVQGDKQKTAKGELLVDDLVAHLGRHDVTAAVNRVNPGSLDVGNIILNQISDNDIDLLVMGGYGTPSLKQKIFGGVTQSILSSMLVPVIMSH